MDNTPDLTIRATLRSAEEISIPAETVKDCLGESEVDRIFDRARQDGLSSIAMEERRDLNRVTGEIAESVAEVLLAEVGLSVFWHITTPGVRGVDLLFLCPDESVLALEVKGTLRAGTIPRLTPSKLRQMSREWLNGPNNPAMAEWGLEADDLYAGVMTVDLARACARIVVSHDFEIYQAVRNIDELGALGERVWL